LRSCGSRRQGRRRLRCAESTASATPPFYKWKAKYGGMEVSDTRRLKALEDENAKLKKLLAEAMLDNAMLRDVAARKW
jgi:putative transposase